MQHNISAQVMHWKSGKVVRNKTTNRDTATLLSLQDKGTGAWIDSIPTSEKPALNRMEFRLVASTKLGCTEKATI